MGNAIEIRDLRKVFSEHKSLKSLLLRQSTLTKALNGITLDIREGEIFGLLGPNGAGKTTLIKILTTLILPTAGTATVYGHDIVRDEQKVRNTIGLIHSDERSFFWRLTGRQNLDFFAAIFKMPARTAKARIDEVIEHVGLQEHADNLFHNYSTGMKQRLAIARGLLNSPRVLFMDEAMRAIDPISTRKIRDFIRAMVRKRNGTSIIMATNRLDEAADLCDRVAILNKGTLVKCGTIQEIEEVASGAVQYEIDAMNLNDTVIAAILSIRKIHDCRKRYAENGKVGITVTLDSEEETIHMVLQEIMKNNGHILRCDRRETSFEESFDKIIRDAETRRREGRK